MKPWLDPIGLVWRWLRLDARARLWQRRHPEGALQVLTLALALTTLGAAFSALVLLAWTLAHDQPELAALVVIAMAACWAQRLLMADHMAWGSLLVLVLGAALGTVGMVLIQAILYFLQAPFPAATMVGLRLLVWLPLLPAGLFLSHLLLGDKRRPQAWRHLLLIGGSNLMLVYLMLLALEGAFGSYGGSPDPFMVLSLIVPLVILGLGAAELLLMHGKAVRR